MLRRIFQTLNRAYAVRANVVLEGLAHIGPGTRLWAPTQLRVGHDVYFGKRCTVEVDGSIGAGTLIANNVGIVGRRDHDMRQVGVSVRRSRWLGNPGCEDLRTSVAIGSDVWIGYGAIVLAPVRVGDGAIVSAGAVVVRDVRPYEVVGGNPATHLGWRFDAPTAAEHRRLLAARASCRLQTATSQTSGPIPVSSLSPESKPADSVAVHPTEDGEGHLA